MTTMAPPTEPNSGEPEEFPSWAIPPQDGFTAEDLDRIPQLPPHTELIDGSLIVVSPQADFHTRMVDLIVSLLRRFSPPHLRVRREMTVTVDERQRPEPDVMVVRKEAVDSLEKTTYFPQDVVLVIEVVSAESQARDRKRKPLLYADAGIPHMWRVENVDSEPIAYTFELEPATGVYVPTGVHHNRLKTSVPFDIDIDLTEIHDM